MNKSKANWARKRRAAHVAWIREAKRVPCVDCGQRFPPECMDFDHRVGTGKRRNVAEATGFSLAYIMEEAAKCDIVCANCHRIRTFSSEDGPNPAPSEDA